MGVAVRCTRGRRRSGWADVCDSLSPRGLLIRSVSALEVTRSGARRDGHAGEEAALMAAAQSRQLFYR